MVQLWSDWQKARGFKLSLTWWRDRWKKMVNGKVEYFRQPNSSEGYEAALLELAQRTQTEEQRRLKMMGVSINQHGKHVVLPGMFPPPLEALANHAKHSPEFADRAIAVLTGNPKSTTHTFGQMKDAFLNFKRRQSEGGSRALGTWGELANDLKYAERFFKATFPIKHLEGKRVTDFNLWLGETTGKGGKKLSESRKFNLFRSFGQLLRWIDRQDDSQLPSSALKALKNPDLRFSTTVLHKASDLLSANQIQAAMELTPQWKAWVLLMLNCGFTQIDIATLKAFQIVGNRLTHKRAKTKRRETPPTVCYKLWPETLAAITAVVDLTVLEPGELVFKSRTGGSLVVDQVIENGERKRSRWDSIGGRWKVLMKAGKVSKPLKFFRKTGRTILRKNIMFAFVSDIYLGHAPKTIGEKNCDLIEGGAV